MLNPHLTNFTTQQQQESDHNIAAANKSSHSYAGGGSSSGGGGFGAMGSWDQTHPMMFSVAPPGGPTTMDSQVLLDLYKLFLELI